jgi:hypothetical protein
MEQHPEPRPEPVSATEPEAEDSVTDTDLPATPPGADAERAAAVYINPRVLDVVDKLRQVREQYGAWDLIQSHVVLSSQKPNDMKELQEILICMIRFADPDWKYDEEGGYWEHASLPGPPLKTRRRGTGHTATNKVETTDAN